MINGVTKLIMMKSDVLDVFPEIKACTAYRLPDGTVTRDFPFTIDGDSAPEPVYTSVPGWMTDMTAMKSEAELPAKFLDYVAFLEKELGVPVEILSVGPDREQTIVRRR